MACCLSPSCCPGRRNGRRRPAAAAKSVTRSSADVGVCLRSKTAVRPSDEGSAPPRTATFVPDVVDRLRRRLCQDGEDESSRSMGSPCRCCRRCLGDVDHATSTELEQRPTVTSADVPPKTEPDPSSTTNVEETDFMTQFFRNCERIVLDNAAAINELLTSPDNCADNEDEQRQTTDIWTSEPSSSTSLVERRRHISDNVSAEDLRSDVASIEAGSAVYSPAEHTEDTSPSCTRTNGVVETLVAPANSPVTSGSVTSSLSGHVSPTAAVMTCACSPSTKTPEQGTDDRLLVVRRRPSVSGQSPAAAPLSATSWTVESLLRRGGNVSWFVNRHRGVRQRTHRSQLAYTSTDDDAHFEVVADRKSAGTRLTLFPVGALGSRPPCLGQECSPIRSTPCGAPPETNSSAATARTTSQGRRVLTPRVVPPGRTQQQAVSIRRRRRRRRSAPYCPHAPGAEKSIDAPSPAVVQQSCHKVDTWLRRHNVGRDDVTTTSGDSRRASGSRLKRKSAGGELDSSTKRRVTDSDSCSLPSGTFTSSDEDDDVTERGTRNLSTAPKDRPASGQLRSIPPSSLQPSPLTPRTPTTVPHHKKRRPSVIVGGRSYHRPSATDETEDVSSGALGDKSSTTWSSLATSNRRQSGEVDRGVSRKNSAQRRRQHVVGRVVRMKRRLHRVAAAEAMSGVHVETLAVL